MKIKLLLALMAFCGSVNAATVSGSIAYNYKGMSGVVPFSMSDGEEVKINDIFKVTPYVKSVPKKEYGKYQEGGWFTLRISPHKDGDFIASYGILLQRLNDVRHEAGIDLLDAWEVSTKGHNRVERGVKTNIFETDDCAVSIVIN